MDISLKLAPAQIQRVTVYASSSSALADSYYDAAARLGTVLAQAGVTVIYGGGGVGLMGAMANNALAHGASVHGVIPEFLNTVEHGHKGLSQLEVVADMRERKHRMLADSHAVITLPGGSGTFEEVFEAMTLKRLGDFLGPIVLVNTNHYFDRLVEFMAHSVNERFMSERHLDMWSVVDEPEQVFEAMHSARPWSRAEREFAAVRR